MQKSEATPVGLRGEWVVGLRLGILASLVVIALYTHGKPGNVLAFLPTLLGVLVAVFFVEPRRIAWEVGLAWVVVFDLAMLGFGIATFGETIDAKLLAVLMLGLGVVCARTFLAGTLVGCMAAGAFLYLAGQHGLELAPAQLLGVVATLVLGGVFAGRLSTEVDLRREELETQTSELRQELAELGAYLKNVLSCVANGVLVVDRAGLVTFFNRAAERILGVAGEGVLGHPLRECSELTSLLGLVESQDAGRQDLGFPHKEGERQIAFERTPLEDVAGERLGTILVFQDVTLLRDYESRMLRQEKLAALGRLISGIAHEFGNSLGGARGLLELAAQELPEEAVSSLPIVSETLDRALETVQNLLTFARGRPLHRVSGVSFAQVVERALHLLKAELEGVELTLELPELPTLHADAVQLEQVVLNLVINALHANADAEERKLRLSLRQEEEELVFGCEDSGPGVSTEAQGKVFEPFFTTKGSLGGSKTPGTGLGLATSLGIVHEHAGTLSVGKSEALGGAAFWVRLPFSASAEQDPTDP